MTLACDVIVVPHDSQLSIIILNAASPIVRAEAVLQPSQSPVFLSSFAVR